MKTDLELVKRAKKNPNDFSLLYERYFKKINNFVYLRVNSHADRQEIVSNVFFKAFSKLSLFRFLEHRKTSFQSWLYRIALNEINMFYRSRKKETTLFEKVNNEQSVEDGEEMIDYKLIKNAMGFLNDEEKNIISLRFFEKCSFKELGEIFRKKENAMKVRTHRIIQKMKKTLEKDYAQVS